MNFEERQQIAVEVAKMYYVNGDPQEHIAEVMGMSRSNISRILKKCILDGTVEVIVHDAITENPQLARKLQLALHLKELIIVPSATSRERLSRNTGERLGLFLMKILNDGMLLGVGQGRSCYYTGQCVQNNRHIRVDVVQLQGAVSPFATMDEANGLICMFASKLNGKGFVLNAPLMVKSKYGKNDMMNSDMLMRTMKKYRQLDAAIFEIESPAFYASQRNSVGPLSEADVLQLAEVGAMACVCGHYYNLSGNSCNAGIHDRLIAVEPEMLKNIAYSIGISTGRHALNATLSILRAGLVNVLVVDENLAQQLSDYLEKNDNKI